MKSKEAVQYAARLADEKKANDILILGMEKLLLITDYFLICSCTSDRHVKTLSQYLQEKLKEKGLKLIGKAGEGNGRWVLLDYGEIVIHVFLAEVRDYYRLESLWKDAPRLNWQEN